MAAGGVKDILIANQVVGAQKVARLVNLRKHADVMVAVDCEEHVEAIDRAAREKGVRIRLVIEINTGMDRAGVDPGEPALALARKIHGREGAELAGLFTWESIALRIEDPEEKKADDRRCTDLGYGHRTEMPKRRDAYRHHQLWRNRHLLDQCFSAGYHGDSGRRWNLL